MNPRSGRFAILVFCLVPVTRASAQTAYGMSTTLTGMTEAAGASASAHRCDVNLLFQGGAASVDYTSGDGRGEQPINGNRNLLIPPNPAYRKTYSWKFFATAGSGASGNVPVRYGGSATAEPSAAFSLTNPGSLFFRFPASTTLGASFKGMLSGKYVYETWNWVPEPTVDGQDRGHYQYAVTTTYEEVTYDPFRLRQVPLDVTAVDTRKTYAPPNKDGAYPAVDPNADLRNVGFAGWAYQGGLFAGNAQGINADQSGIARIQCQATVPTNMPACVYTLSLLHIGPPSYFKSTRNQWDAAMSLQAYVPVGTATANVPIANVTWANAMDVTNTSVAQPYGDPVSLTTANEYVNFQMGSAFPYRVALASTSEGQAAWRYFCGPTFDRTPSQYPYSEGKPHLWACESPISPSARSYSNGQTPGSGGW